MGKLKKKFQSGAATAFIARNQAIKKLQLTIADFRRLCILKGVYPVEPKNKKKVNKGHASAANRTFYYAKDIAYLSHEPIINKFREFKVYVKRLKRARGRRDVKALGRLRAHKPTYNLDHIVKERYPSYFDAVRDLDDCLSLIFLFSNLPKSKRVYVEKVHFCRRLVLEFMHYVIASKSLRKCFISIKGYYFQADIKGHKVTWIMPHKLAYQVPDDVDFRIMSTFVEFYSIMLGFVNYKSYTDIGLIYPPKLSISDKSREATNGENTEDEEDFKDEYLASLNCDFIKVNENANDESSAGLDEFPAEDEEENVEFREKVKLEEDQLKKLKTLFKGLKFFLNREVPREQFVFAIRAFSGDVSWEKSLALGATYQEDDETITHHVVDRPIIAKPYLNRVYVQPQWIFDSINECMLLPVADYLPGAMLPPHLSPFVDNTETGYIPPEKQRIEEIKMGKVETQTDASKAAAAQQLKTKVEEVTLKNSNSKKTAKSDTKSNGKQKKPDGEEKKKEEDDEEVEAEFDMKVDLESPDEEESESEEEEDEEDEEENKKKAGKEKPKIAVAKAKPREENTNVLLKKQAAEEKRLNELMIPKKDKRLYDRIVHAKKKQRQEIEKLKEKRANYEKGLREQGNKRKN